MDISLRKVGFLSKKRDSTRSHMHNMIGYVQALHVFTYIGVANYLKLSQQNMNAWKTVTIPREKQRCLERTIRLAVDLLCCVACEMLYDH